MQIKLFHASIGLYPSKNVQLFIPMPDSIRVQVDHVQSVHLVLVCSRSLLTSLGLVLLEIPGYVEGVVGDERQGGVRVRILAQLLQLEHVHRAIQRSF